MLKFCVAVAGMVIGIILLVGGLQAIAGGYLIEGALAEIIVGGIILYGGWMLIRQKKPPDIGINISDKLIKKLRE